MTAKDTTKDRILNAAERLFAQHGLDATSLRRITSEAGVNLAAVNYHFQSKDALIDAVFGRRLGPVNERRLALLEAYEQAAGDGPLEVEPILNAFLQPIVENAVLLQSFRPLMGRMHAVESEAHFQSLATRHLLPVINRFAPALQRALPGVPLEEFVWRVQFSIGVMAFTVATAHRTRMLSNGLIECTDPKDVFPRMIRYISAGLRAPLANSKAGE